MKKESTIRWNSPETKKQVQQIARRRGTSVNKLVNSWGETVIAQEQAEASFRAAARRGNVPKAIKLLDRLDREDRRKGVASTKP